MQDNWFQRSAEILKRTKEVDLDQDGNYIKLAQTILQFIILPVMYSVVFFFALPYFFNE